MVDEYKYDVRWSPKEDITTWELAQCVPYLYSKLHDVEVWDNLDESVSRHFTVSKMNYSKMIREQARKLNEALR
jgi:hypothetical protein